MNATTNKFYPKLFVTILRVAIGWHFIYEGLSKILQGNWTASSYLLNTSGFLSGFYHALASSPAILSMTDFLNMYGLFLIGLALFIGLFCRVASICGALLLTLYYFAYPPFGDSLFSMSEGHLFIVDKNFIECAALLFIVFFREKGYGFDTLISYFRKKRSRTAASEDEDMPQSNTRRELVKNLASLPVLGLLGWWSSANNRKYGVDVMSGATIQLNKSALGELKGVLPKGKIGKHEISRLVMGGNLIGGWAHSRDLIYVPDLFKAYNTEKKIYETLILGEKAGINTINIGFPTNTLMAKYKRMTGSKITVVSQVAPNMEKGDYFEQINKAMDLGADILQVQGNWCDWLTRDRKTEII
ncbi:MAG TPA: DoxX family protein, partial [Prolixibacteraceae bacterium]|nr:DoxX family protein [Prolixibacteraceae bacterium]